MVKNYTTVTLKLHPRAFKKGTPIADEVVCGILRKHWNNDMRDKRVNEYRYAEMIHRDLNKQHEIDPG